MRFVHWPAMSVTVVLPDHLARRLEAEAARRGVSAEELAVQAIEGRYGAGAANEDDGDALDAFIGSASSGRMEPVRHPPSPDRPRRPEGRRRRLTTVDGADGRRRRLGVGRRS
jgi:hypothetical protein